MLRLEEFGKDLTGALRRDDRGASMAEYGLLLMVIVLVVVPALIVLGPIVAAWYTAVIGAL